MFNLDQWAIKHGVGPLALSELKQSLGVDNPSHMNECGATSETAVSKRVQLEASKKGGRLWRNNSGVAMNANGAPVRFGLGNESPDINRVFKSPDLVGIMPVRVTPHMVGSTIGVFTGREVKRPGWTYRGTDRERAQLNSIELILKLGGDASFCVSEGTLG